MNFTREIKRDLLKSAPEDREGCLALLAAAIDTGGAYTENGFSFTGESEESAAYLIAVAERCVGAPMLLTEVSYDPKHGRDKLTFSYRDGDGSAVRALAAHSPARGLGERCGREYLKGAFLGGGSCTLPSAETKTSYHLEFLFSDGDKAEDFIDLLDDFQVIAGRVRRGERIVVYVKSREAISDFLGVIGATGALRTFAGVSAAREASNAENRLGNCFQGNADKAAIASAAQVVAFEKLRAQGKLSALPEQLREAAQGRLLNPALSLGELAEALGVSRSCLSHRLRKLMEIARSLE